MEPLAHVELPTIIKTNVANITKKAARFLMILTSAADSTPSA